MEQVIIIAVLMNMGYKKKAHGYQKLTDNTTHWVTLFDTSMQIWGFPTEAEHNDEVGKTYDTGTVAYNTFTPALFRNVIDLFLINHQ